MRILSPLLFLALATFAACGGKDNRVPDPEANCGAQQNQAPLPPRTSIDARDLRPVVEIRFYNTRRPTNQLVDMQGTGVIVGRTSVLTVAHNLERADSQYNEVRVAVRGRDGRMHETDVIHVTVNPNFNGFTYAGDLALLQVDTDLEALGITPATVATDYLPPRDCQNCPLASDLQFYGYGTAAGPSDQLRGLNSNPLNSVRNIQDSGVMTFQAFTEPGDSGGPHFRPNQNGLQVVGLHVGRVDRANDRFEIDGDRGNVDVAVATTIRQSDWDALNAGAEDYRHQNQGFFTPQYPDPDDTWPNGESNEDVHGGDLPQLPTHGQDDPLNPANSTNGYFVGDYPATNVIHLIQPGPANGCG